MVYFAAGLSMFLGLAFDASRGGKGTIALGAYTIGQVVPAVFGSEMLFVVSDIFVPLVSCVSRVPLHHTDLKTDL